MSTRAVLTNIVRTKRAVTAIISETLPSSENPDEHYVFHDQTQGYDWLDLGALPTLTESRNQ